MNFYPSCRSAGDRLFKDVFAQFWNFPWDHTKPPFHIIHFGLKQGIPWTLAVLWASIWSRLEKIFRICHLSVTKGTQTVAVGQSHTWVMGHFTPKSFPHWLPKYGEPGSASILGCGSLLSLTHPLETPTGEGRRLCDRNQEVTSSSLCRTLGGVGKRSKCGWEASQTTEGPALRTSGFH